MSERRKFSRLPFPARSTILSGTRRYETQLIDISIKGALVSQPPGWAEESATEVELEVRLGDSEVVILMQMAVAHARDDELGLACLSIDLESLTHLRRLLELNLGDPHLVERELSALG